MKTQTKTIVEVVLTKTEIYNLLKQTGIAFGPPKNMIITMPTPVPPPQGTGEAVLKVVFEYLEDEKETKLGE